MRGGVVLLYKGNLLLTILGVSIFLAACTNQYTIENKSDIQKADTFYENKDIEIIVPFEAGGGTDLFARFMAQSLSQNIVGNPSIEVLNIPGDNTIIGTNEFVYMSELNGKRLLASSASVHTPYLLGLWSVKYDLRDLEPIIGMPTGGVVYTSPETGILKPADLESFDEELVFKGISATGLDLVMLLAFEVLGLDVQATFDRGGRRSASFLFEVGTSTIDFQTTSSYLENIVPLIERNEAIPLFSFGQINEKGNLVRDPMFPDLPTLEEVYIDIHGKAPIGKAWEAYKTFVNSSYSIQKVIWTHGDAPEVAKEALYKATEKTARDSSFHHLGQGVLEQYEPYTGEELRMMIDNAFNTSPAILNWVRELLKEKYGLEN